MHFVDHHITASNIDRLLARSFAGELSSDESQLLDSWAALSIENKEFVERFRKLWDAGEILRNTSSISGHEELERFYKKIAYSQVKPGSSLRVRKSWIWWTAAAAVLASLVVLSVTFKAKQPRTSGQNAILAVSSGNAAKKIVLPDGTSILLYPHSILRYSERFSDSVRRVSLTGDGFFTVSHDSLRPFKISVNQITVTVLGTSFILKSSDSNTYVSVLTGVVEVDGYHQSTRLHAHEKLTVPIIDTTWTLEFDNQKIITTIVNSRLLQKPAPLKINTASSPDDDLVPVPLNQFEFQEGIMLAILNDLVRIKIAPSLEAIYSVALNDSSLVVNDINLPEPLATRFKSQYIPHPGLAYYFGDVDMPGKGFFFTRKQINQLIMKKVVAILLAGGLSAHAASQDMLSGKAPSGDHYQPSRGALYQYEHNIKNNPTSQEYEKKWGQLKLLESMEGSMPVIQVNKLVNKLAREKQTSPDKITDQEIQMAIQAASHDKKMRDTTGFVRERVHIEQVKQQARAIVADLIEDKIIQNKSDLVWFGLTSGDFIVNGTKQPVDVQVRYGSKYITDARFGIFYGPVQMHGTGTFLDADDLQ